MERQHYDLLGDIHGQHKKLRKTLQAMGYEERGKFRGWSHPQNRKLILLGDYLNRGPAIRETLHEVRGLVESGDAMALLGNHEFDALLAWFGSESRDLAGALNASTLQQFVGHEAEYRSFLTWMAKQPLYLDLGNVRAVHACWDSHAVARLEQAVLCEEEWKEVTENPRSVLRRDLERLLDGPSLAVPPDCLIRNSRGMPLTKIRVRWWNLPTREYPIGDLAFPDSACGCGWIAPEALEGISSYGAGEPPVFFGHYWRPADDSLRPVAPNLACLDYSAGRGRAPLIAYRWNGEQNLREEHFFLPGS